MFTLISRLGFLHWTADLFSLFHLPYFWVSLLLSILLLTQRKWRWAGLGLATTVLNLYLLLPFYLPSQRAEEGNLRLYVHNIYYQNSELESVVNAVRQTDPDVVFLMEYSHAIASEIEEAFADYPYNLIDPSRYTMGLALFSKFPLGDSQVYRFDTRIPIFHTSVSVGEQAFDFVGAHPWPPIGRWGNLHRQQMIDIAEVAKNAKHPLIVAGDFNASPWSHAVGQLKQQADVTNAKHGFGLTNTWHLNRIFGLPIDHIFVSEGLKLASFKQLESFGSDHNALLLDINFRP